MISIVRYVHTMKNVAEAKKKMSERKESLEMRKAIVTYRNSCQEQVNDVEDVKYCDKLIWILTANKGEMILNIDEVKSVNVVEEETNE